MNESLKLFLESHGIAVIAVNLPDGALHGATIHYSWSEDPLRFFIQTSRKTKKVSSLLDGSAKKAAMVIGFSEEEWRTCQLSGEIQIISEPRELEEAYAVHWAKHPDKERHKGPETVLLEFKPSWWRYTDSNTKPRTIIENVL